MHQDLKEKRAALQAAESLHLKVCCPKGSVAPCCTLSHPPKGCTADNKQQAARNTLVFDAILTHDAKRPAASEANDAATMDFATWTKNLIADVNSFHARKDKRPDTSRPERWSSMLCANTTQR
jgi:hypothetical protein